MSEVRVRENESLESALKRFKRQCARSGVIQEVRKREHYEKPSVKRKKKAEAAGASIDDFCHHCPAAFLNGPAVRVLCRSPVLIVRNGISLSRFFLGRGFLF